MTMANVRAIAEAARNRINRLFPRLIRSANGPSLAGHSVSGDAREKLDALELWSGRATLIILAGIVIDVGIIWIWPHESRWETIWALTANVLIGAGLVIEYIVILRAIVASGDVQRDSDEKVAAAVERAAAAERETEWLKKEFAWRQLSPEAMAKLSDAIERAPSPLALRIEIHGQ